MSGSNRLNRPSKAKVVVFTEDSQLVLFPME